MDAKPKRDGMHLPRYTLQNFSEGADGGLSRRLIQSEHAVDV